MVKKTKMGITSKALRLCIHKKTPRVRPSQNQRFCKIRQRVKAIKQAVGISGKTNPAKSKKGLEKSPTVATARKALPRAPVISRTRRERYKAKAVKRAIVTAAPKRPSRKNPGSTSSTGPRG